MKNEEINADMAHKPKYVNPREDYEGFSKGVLSCVELFDSKKASEKADKAREEERVWRSRSQKEDDSHPDSRESSL